MKKLKCVFIDMIEDRQRRSLALDEPLPLYSTFQEYSFDKHIGSRVNQLFGWTTDLIKNSFYELSIHVITSDYLNRHGVAQHFYSPHGPKYDDKYSYLHGMNLLAFEGYNRVHLIYTITKLDQIFQKKQVTSDSRKKIQLQRLATDRADLPFLVPVDHPRIGILTPSKNLNSFWVNQLRNQDKNVIISDNFRDLVPDIEPTEFVDFSLSRSYKYSLDDYIPLLDSIIKMI
ncbi:MAG: hypothetical protein ACFFB2_08550 [Promethearchaeota archaeon]